MSGRSGQGQKMSRKQEQAVAALLLKPTIREAAQAVGIGEATMFRWLQIPEFQSAYREAKRETVGQAVSLLQRAASEAVETLRAVMADTRATGSARVQAARVVLEFSLRAVEIEDLGARVEELEELAKRQG